MACRSGGEERDGEIFVRSYSTASVFDVSQTDGDPLPEPPPLQSIEGDTHAHLLPALEAYAASLGYSVRYDVTDPDYPEDRQ